MTDQTPATESGRRLLDRVAPFAKPSATVVNRLSAVERRKGFERDILAIEAEARADADIECNSKIRDAEQRGRADALREAAERVPALAAPKYDGDTWTKDCEHGWDTHEAAVLAILDPQ